MSLIEVNNLTVGYDNEVVASGISFRVNEGDYLCIVGENGSGKSTLMKTLLHLQKPLSGEIIFGDGMKRGEIGYLPQQTLVQKDFPASVKEIVLSGCQAKCGMRPFYNKEEKALALQNMRRMGIEDLANRSYRDLSGGQQQRVLLARALCAAGKVLLLDEPVAGLDPKVTAEMYERIEKLNKEGVAIIMVSHDIAAAVRYADYILHMGERIFYTTKEKYMESEEGSFFIRMQNKEEQDNV
ncbi:MAG: ABC transporter ATP-binding protein [Lachnospiraceae bacterium]|nr:ABC transporter ATP-binding protein [Lachnospiraceae bacterium]MBQ6637724.1 ABC transporter ATP-binding protein [Lachnospiraceae bacterium]MBR3637523.1 ABC transporter ATP-binding protein [Lachnospiraceae bacterium]